MKSTITFSKSFLIVSVLLFVESVICTQIPLLNYLGFEFSILNALFAGLLCGFLVIAEWKRKVPASDEDYWGYVKSALTSSLLVVVIPLVVISVNAANVKNCSFTQGFRLYLLYVIPSVVFCASLGTVASVLARKHKRFLFVVLFISVLAQIPYVTMTRPQIFAFNPIAGYFPGFTYDETLGGEMRLLVYRAGTLAASAALLTFSFFGLRHFGKEFHKSGGPKRSIHYTATIAGCLIVCLCLFRVSDTVGFSSSEAFITRELGGLQYTAHFKIVYPKKNVGPDQLRRIAILHEYLFAQLSDEWQVSPWRPITVFIYASPQQKERLIGAAATDFTKPWLRQININLADVDGALKHELVHAMLAERGIPFLQIAPNSGLIEGAAVASERFVYDESLHQVAAEILALGIHPDVAGMFSAAGFFKAYPGVSYVLAGSFCRYLIDRYGVERFKKLYRSGSFETLYHKGIGTLISDWSTVISSIPLSREDLEKAAYLFKRSPLFGKECARVIANINARTRVLLDQREYAKALASSEESLGLSKSTDAVYQKSLALFRLGEYPQAIVFIENQLEETSTRTSLLPLRVTLGDSYWAVNDFKHAQDEYSKVLADSLSLPMNEAMIIRLQILPDPSMERAFKPYFLQDLSDSARVSFLESLKTSPASDPLARYLLGREYARQGRDNLVVQELRVLPAMNSQILGYLSNRRMARSMFNLGNYERAKLYSWRALNYVSNDAQLFQLEDFLQSCIWIEERSR